MFPNYILGGAPHGEHMAVLDEVRYDPGMMRPYIDAKGRRCVTINTGKVRTNAKTGKPEPIYQKVLIKDLMDRGIYSPVFNSTLLRKDEYVQMDDRVRVASRERLRAVADLSAVSTIGGFDAYAAMTYEYEAISDPGEVRIDMEGLANMRNDNIQYKLRSTPIPLIRGGFHLSARRIAASRRRGMPVPTTLAEAMGRRCAEGAEGLLIGTTVGPEFGTRSTGFFPHDGVSKVYGYTTHPARITKTNLTAPTGSNPEATVADVLAMRQLMYNNKFYEPFMLYHSSDWDTYLDNDYARLGGSNANMTLRDRLRAIEGVMDVSRLDFLRSATNPYTLLLVRMGTDSWSMINGMDITTTQWPMMGGELQNFAVTTIQVPICFYDYNGVAPIVHGTTS